MIENSTNELRGQTELSDFLTEGTGHSGDHRSPQPAEGYDAEGHLLNVDYPPVGEMLPHRSGEVPAQAGDGAPQEADPHTPADARLSQLAGEINAITGNARVVLANASIEVGKRLIEAKGLCPQGRFFEWCKTNVDYSMRQVEVLMQIADTYGRGELPEAFRGLGVSHLTALLAAPAEEREGMAQRAQDDGLSVRQLKAEIAKLKEVREEAQLTIDRLSEELRDTRQALTDTEEARNRAYEESLTAERAIEKEREAAQLADARAKAAEASAEELRKLHSDAEDRAAASAQRASDAVNRANKTAEDMRAARARIAELESREQGTGNREQEVRTVEVIPEATQRELDDLRRQLTEAQAKAADVGAISRSPAPTDVSAVDAFKAFYADQMKPAFTRALALLEAVAQEDANAANMYATALVNGCKQLMNKLGEEARA